MTSENLMTKRMVTSLWAFLCILLVSNIVTIWLVVQTRKEASQAQTEAFMSHEWARSIGHKLEVDPPLNDGWQREISHEHTDPP